MTMVTRTNVVMALIGYDRCPREEQGQGQEAGEEAYVKTEEEQEQEGGVSDENFHSSIAAIAIAIAVARQSYRLIA